MYVYAGIDEAGYGPFFGPLVVGRTVLGVAGLEPDVEGLCPPAVWRLLSKAVCRGVSGRRGKIAVNDSKKLHTQAGGIKHLELGVLAFCGMMGYQATTVDAWLRWLGDGGHGDLTGLPWYAPSEDHPWGVLPCATTAGEVAVARSMLGTAAAAAGVSVADVGASILFEDRFNRMVAATRSKAAASFTLVAGHLQAIWERFGVRRPVVVVDRQSGRMRYRELLAMSFPGARMVVLEENESVSAYRLEQCAGREDRGERSMVVRFEVAADGGHFPVALASMVSKYTRELLMKRFQAWFARRVPQVKPTAGYGVDGKRFWRQIEPVLPGLSIDAGRLLRSR